MRRRRASASEGDARLEQQIERLAAAPDSASVDELLLAEPALLGIDPKALRSARRGNRTLLATAATRLIYYKRVLTSDPRSYPFGRGPIERLWARCNAGEITLDVAESLAAAPGVTNALHPLYLRWLAGESLERERVGNWKQALELHTLIRAAARAFEPLAHAERWVRADLAHCELGLVTVLLVHRADAALYRSAMDAGRAMVAEARARGDARLEGRFLHLMGHLIYNVYLRFPNDASYTTQLDQWRYSLPRTAGASLAERPEASWLVPPADDELAQGIQYLRRAAALRSGAEHGQSLSLLAPMVALHSALAERAAHHGEPPTGVSRCDEAVRIAREALARIGPDDLDDRVYLLELLHEQGEPIALADLQPAVDRDADEWHARLGSSSFAVVMSLVNLVAPLDVDRALELMRKALHLTERFPYEPFYDDLYRVEMRLLDQQSTADSEFAAFTAQLGSSSGDITTKLNAFACDRGWRPTMLASAFAALALRAAGSEDPARGLRLVSEARRASPEFATRFGTALQMLEADIWSGVARQLGRRNELPDALAAISAATARYLRAGARSTAEEHLEVMQTIASSTPNPMEAIQAIAPIALELELELGDGAVVRIQEMIRRALDRMRTTRMSSDDYLTALHLAKGLRFSTALTRWSAPDVDSEAASMLERIGQVELEIRREPAAPEPELTERDLDLRILSVYIDALSLWGITELVPGPPAEEGGLDPTPARKAGAKEKAFGEAFKRAHCTLLTLTTQSSENERETGVTPRERLTNLQRRFDWSREKDAARRVGEQASALTRSELQGLLDERTVLLDLYIGRSTDEPTSVALYSLLATSMSLDAHVEKLRFSEGWMTIVSSGLALSSNAMAMSVAQARLWAMQATTGARVVGRDGAAGFERDQRDYLGRIVDTLATLREQGKDHLCIVPHGPLHFHPLHLLGRVGHALADEWIVTYLPSLQCLRRARQQPTPQRRGQLAALGLGFAEGKPHDLVPLPSSIDELNAVASAFGVRPLIDDEATEEAFIDALTSHRYVHLSTHGQQNADAPAFQVVYLSPGRNSDGRLYVHELAGVDMRGLEILSLSACETALGRFDAGDNLRGLPARCFISGAQTVISTLWEANASASKQFFTAFYQRLAEGDGKLDAFAVAQRETRRSYPKYADWGAFSFMGDWR